MKGHARERHDKDNHAIEGQNREVILGHFALRVEQRAGLSIAFP